MPIATAYLGTWQLQRLQWKLDMIQQLEDKLNQDPVRLPAHIESVPVPPPKPLRVAPPKLSLSR